MVKRLRRWSRPVRQKVVDLLLDGLHLRGVRFGENSIEMSPSGVGDVVRWSATKNAVAAGDLGMNTSTGRPSFFDGSTVRNVAHTDELGGGGTWATVLSAGALSGTNTPIFEQGAQARNSGNPRGTNAFDFQATAAAATAVASGAGSFLAGGRDNTLDQSWSGMLGGYGNEIGSGVTTTPSVMLGGSSNLLQYGAAGWCVAGASNSLSGTYDYGVSGGLVVGTNITIGETGGMGAVLITGQNHVLNSGMLGDGFWMGGEGVTVDAGNFTLTRSIIMGTDLHCEYGPFNSLFMGAVSRWESGSQSGMIGRRNYMEADFAWVTGHGAAATIACEVAQGPGKFSNEAGGAQRSVFVLAVVTGATGNAELTARSGATIILENDQAYYFRVLASAFNTGGGTGTIGDSAGWRFEGLAVNVGGTVTLEGIDLPGQTAPAQSKGAGSGYRMEVDVTGTRLRVQFNPDVTDACRAFALVEVARAGDPVSTTIPGT